MNIFEILRETTLEMTSQDFRNRNLDPAMIAAVEEEMKADMTPEFREQIIASFSNALKRVFEYAEKIEDISSKTKFYEKYIKMFEIVAELTAVHLELMSEGK